MNAPYRLSIGVALLALAAAQWASADAPDAADAKSLERGRYLLRIAGCNDCHTPGYMETAGKVPEAQWLTGDRLGWHGPWGTTYASNLRLVFQGFTEDEWVAMAKVVQYRPPMPWFALRDLSEKDLRAIYRIVRHLGPAGEHAPDYLPPGQEPPAPFVLFPSPPE